jgi:hypothetical protein
VKAGVIGVTAGSISVSCDQWAITIATVVMSLIVFESEPNFALVGFVPKAAGKDGVRVLSNREMVDVALEAWNLQTR